MAVSSPTTAQDRRTANGRDEGPIWWTRQGLVDDPLLAIQCDLERCVLSTIEMSRSLTTKRRFGVIRSDGLPIVDKLKPYAAMGT